MKNIFFVRHGQTEWNSIRRVQGQWNSSLNHLGEKQANKNGEFLRDKNIDYMFCSPLDRTRQTAEILCAHLPLQAKFDERLMEWDTGKWSGFMWEEIPEKWPDGYSQWEKDPFNYRCPGGENYPDMIDRVTPFIESLKKLKETNIVIVSHGIIGRVMIGLILKHSPEQMLSYHQSNDTVIKLTQSPESVNAEHFISGVGPYIGLPESNRQG